MAHNAGPGDLIVNINNKRINESVVRVLSDGSVIETRKGFQKTCIYHSSLDSWVKSIKDNIGTLLLIKEDIENSKEMFDIVVLE